MESTAITIVNLDSEEVMEMDLFADDLDQRLNAATVSSTTCISSASCAGSCAACACCFSCLCCGGATQATVSAS